MRVLEQGTVRSLSLRSIELGTNYISPVEVAMDGCLYDVRGCDWESVRPLKETLRVHSVPQRLHLLRHDQKWDEKWEFIIGGVLDDGSSVLVYAINPLNNNQ